MASVSVHQEGNMIHAIFTGTMTLELVREAEQQIEALVNKIANPVVLFDSLAMTPPTMKLALEMKAFDGRIRSRVIRSATVVRDAGTAFMAKVAFVLSREHKVFYDDADAACAWLKGASVGHPVRDTNVSEPALVGARTPER